MGKYALRRLLSFDQDEVFIGCGDAGTRKETPGLPPPVKMGFQAANEVENFTIVSERVLPPSPAVYQKQNVLPATTAPHAQGVKSKLHPAITDSVSDSAQDIHVDKIFWRYIVICILLRDVLCVWHICHLQLRDCAVDIEMLWVRRAASLATASAAAAAVDTATGSGSNCAGCAAVQSIR